MQLHLERTKGTNQINAYGPGFFVINGNRVDSSIIIGPTTLTDDWPITAVAELDEAMAAQVLAAQPELVVLGTGSKHLFPSGSIMAQFDAARVGLEVMNTGAACRTYNVLLSEGRNVVAMLIRIKAD